LVTLWHFTHQTFNEETLRDFNVPNFSFLKRKK